MSSIIVILGDQLNINISSLKNCQKDKDKILMCEVLEECTTPKHHKKKIAFILSCMRHFAKELKSSGFDVFYTNISDPENTHSFKSEIVRFCKKHKINNVKVTHPGEYRVLQDLISLKKENIDIKIVEDDRFLCSIDEFRNFAKNRKSLLMESFYRFMRIKYNILKIGRAHV